MIIMTSNETKLKNILRKFMRKSLSRGEYKMWFPLEWYDDAIVEIKEVYKDVK